MSGWASGRALAIAASIHARSDGATPAANLEAAARVSSVIRAVSGGPTTLTAPGDRATRAAPTASSATTITAMTPVRVLRASMPDVHRLAERAPEAGPSGQECAS